MGFITSQGASNLANYKYSGVDQSILAKLFFSKFWNWLVNYIPTYIAPNLLTLCGLASIYTGYLLLWSYCPDMEGSAPWWVYFFVAFFVFAYQTLDNLDGKQARRTGTSSPLGEAFDHGGDSTTVGAFAIILGTALQFGPILTFVTFIQLMVIFYLCHWEAFFTGSLILRPIDNPTEAQVALMTVLVATGIFGTGLWEAEFNLVVIGPVQLNHIIFFFYVLGGVNTILDSLARVYEHQTNTGQSKLPPALCFAPVGVIILVSILSVLFVPSLLLDSPRLFISTIGVYFSYVQIRLIIQGVCKEPFKPFYNVISALFVFTFNAMLEWLGVPIVESSFLLIIIFLIGVGNLGYLVYSLITELCTILGIRPFTIRPPLPVERELPI